MKREKWCLILIQRRMLDLENGWRGSILTHQDGSLHEWHCAQKLLPPAFYFYFPRFKRNNDATCFVKLNVVTCNSQHNRRYQQRSNHHPTQLKLHLNLDFTVPMYHATQWTEFIYIYKKKKTLCTLLWKKSNFSNSKLRLA